MPANRRMPLVLAFLAMTQPAAAETHVVEMRNAAVGDPGTINVFDPPILRIAVGDTVRFKVIDKGHNSASKKGMIPDGASPWNGKIDEEIEITFTVEAPMAMSACLIRRWAWSV